MISQDFKLLETDTNECLWFDVGFIKRLWIIPEWPDKMLLDNYDGKQMGAFDLKISYLFIILEKLFRYTNY